MQLKSVDKKWFTYNGVDEQAEFLIRPFPFSSVKLGTDNTIKHLLEQFNYCLLEWKGIEVDGEPYPCNRENKKFLFDYEDGIRDFVFDKARELAGRTEDELKN